MPSRSLDEAYFDRLYATADDPWNFATSPYERDKYVATLAALGAKRFTRAFEIGCSIGVLTAMLAPRCDGLLSIDISERAIALARERCGEQANLRIEKMTFPGEFPAGNFDLVVLSEVGYYWSDGDLSLAKDRIAKLGAGGLLQLVHFLPKVEEYVRDGDAVHAAFIDDPRFTAVGAARREKYRIDVLRVAD
ncbi:MAG: nodulation S family protein [Candidatus Eremiobacteraeota bacterium]|nr:nodulation S family protein [Candidatus Eremiobacteraeota bacterium]